MGLRSLFREFVSPTCVNLPFTTLITTIPIIPEDGSNWELLCLYCHDHEHSKYTEADQYGTTVIAGEDAQKDVGEAK